MSLFPAVGITQKSWIGYFAAYACKYPIPCICIFAMAEAKSINEARFILRILMEKNLAHYRQSQGQIGRMRSRRVSSLPHRDPELWLGLLGRRLRQASTGRDMLYFATCAPPLWFGSDSTCDWPTIPYWRLLSRAAEVSCRYSSGRPRKKPTGRQALRAAGGHINPCDHSTPLCGAWECISSSAEARRLMHCGR